MQLDLDGHCALVTGSSSGIGAAVVKCLAGEGARVIVHGRDAAKANAVRAEIESEGGTASTVIADLDDPEAVSHLAAAMRSHDADILVNNAGPFAEDDWSDTDPDAWAKVYHDNVVVTAALIGAVLPHLRSRGWGRIVTIGSRAVTTPLPNMVSYSAAKAAVLNMTTSLAAHLANTGVTANCVSPGVVLTPSLQRMFLDRFGDGQANWDDIEGEVTEQYAPNPTGRLARPEDIAAAVTFLVSPRADYVNAANIRVDGGITGAV